ncbi:hypothetical protein DPMN_099962 [Dreissena polymorpha]|uniref:Uncharacterized protein n=1 Tax=Dreissena polymorpha TaxID=45954 RepID=A0A9D4R8N8_DREPO|nr:hypothetical protein DPMN_099962 [Dreissena polymorpha]
MVEPVGDLHCLTIVLFKLVWPGRMWGFVVCRVEVAPDEIESVPKHDGVEDRTKLALLNPPIVIS